MVSPEPLLPYRIPVESVPRTFETDFEQGLSTAEATARLARYGRNELSEDAGEPWWKALFAQFQQLVVVLLIVAGIIAGALGDWTDAAAIFAIIILNALLGYFQEARAAKALDALRKMGAPHCKVLRDGHWQTLSTKDLVPGDVLQLEAGDAVPADARLVTAYGVMSQEAALTGESVPVIKSTDTIDDATVGIGDRKNMVHCGALIAAGKGTAVVTATGMQTELGQIAGLLQNQPPETTPLQRRLEELGRWLIIVCVALVAIIFCLQVARGGKVAETLLVAISLAVAAVPEGLPAVVTITLALGLQRLARRNALVRKLPSVETLGAVTVICSDKTGTLTRNEMTVRQLYVGGRHYSVSGAGYTHDGQITPVDAASETDATHADVRWAVTIGAVCNNAEVELGTADEPPRITGDPTEAALLIAARKHGYDGHTHAPGTIEHENPFDSERKTMSVVVERPDGVRILLVKGAPEMLLSRCTAELRAGSVQPLAASRRDEIIAVNADLASRALRVLALAYRIDLPQPHSVQQEQDLIFAGLAGMIDPPRDEVRPAVQRCRAAGIQPVMITGDHPATAFAIARELGMAREDQRVITGAELSTWTDEDLTQAVPTVAVYARVSAAHKLRIIEAWKRRGDVVAMTGDGVNDAPAVQAADIGIAMGITGTDVTRAAADLVLTDDNFASIVNAVEEGRGIYANIHKFVLYLLTCNAGEVLMMFLASLIGLPSPLHAIQVLWINLITDGLPALALAMEPTEADAMERPPRDPQAPVLGRAEGVWILGIGLLIALAALAVFWIVYEANPDQLEEARTSAFCMMALTQLWFAIGCRSPHKTMPQLGWFTNPVLFVAIAASAALQILVIMWPVCHPWLETTGLSWIDWAWIFAFSLVPVSLVELGKLIAAARRR